MALITRTVVGNKPYRNLFSYQVRSAPYRASRNGDLTMKRIGLAATTAIILATTVPAVGQGYDYYGGRGWWGGERHYRHYGYRPYRHSYRYYHRDCYGYGCGRRGYGYRSWWGGGRY